MIDCPPKDGVAIPSADVKWRKCEAETTKSDAKFKIKDGSVGRRRIKQLAENTKYFRSRLTELGYHILGNDDSPIVPIIIYLSAKIKCKKITKL